MKQHCASSRHGLHRVASLLVIALITALGGCSGGATTIHQASFSTVTIAPKVAVLPLVNLTTYPNAGQILGEVLYAELKSMPSWTLQDSSVAWNHLAKSGQDPDETLTRVQARKVGQELGVDLIVFGSVTEYRYKRDLDQEPAVGVIVSVMDVASGQTVFSATVSRIGSSELFCRDSLMHTAQIVSRQIVRELRKASGGAPQPVQDKS